MVRKILTVIVILFITNIAFARIIKTTISPRQILYLNEKHPNLNFMKPGDHFPTSYEYFIAEVRADNPEFIKVNYSSDFRDFSSINYFLFSIDVQLLNYDKNTNSYQVQLRPRDVIYLIKQIEPKYAFAEHIDKEVKSDIYFSNGQKSIVISDKFVNIPYKELEHIALTMYSREPLNYKNQFIINKSLNELSMLTTREIPITIYLYD